MALFRDEDLIQEIHSFGELVAVVLRDGDEEVYHRVVDGRLVERLRVPMTEDVRASFAARDADTDVGREQG